MKLLPLLFASLLLLVPSAWQDSPELKEAADLTESVVKLINEKKYSDALAPAKRALEIREKLLPSNDPRMCSGPPYLSESSVAAAYKARFSPTLVSGKPAHVYGVIQYNFVNRSSR